METLVVADTKMIEYHGSENIEKYVLTVMNMVSPGPQQQSRQAPGDTLGDRQATGLARTHPGGTSANLWPAQPFPPRGGFSVLLSAESSSVPGGFTCCQGDRVLPVFSYAI